MDKRRRVFVTVGTTSFDKLIKTVSDSTTLQVKDYCPLRNFKGIIINQPLVDNLMKLIRLNCDKIHK